MVLFIVELFATLNVSTFTLNDHQGSCYVKFTSGLHLILFFKMKWKNDDGHVTKMWIIFLKKNHFFSNIYIYIYIYTFKKNKNRPHWDYKFISILL